MKEDRRAYYNKTKIVYLNTPTKIVYSNTNQLLMKMTKTQIRIDHNYLIKDQMINPLKVMISSISRMIILKIK